MTLNVNVDGTTYTTNAITLTGTQATDLESVAAAINQALGSAGGIVATVNSAGTGIQLSGTRCRRRRRRAASRWRAPRTLPATQ